MAIEGIPPQIELINRERLEKLQTLELSVKGDLGPLLAKINNELNVELAPRSEGPHITIINPTESKVISHLSDEQIAELQTINAEVCSGEGIQVDGIGFIDGNTTENIRDADKEKKTAFLAFSIPRLNEFRQSLGLPPKDFHVTLGFQGGDIHMKINGKDEKGKNIIIPIDKKKDPALDRFVEDVPDLQFIGLDGQER